jgi:hypothetical protein
MYVAAESHRQSRGGYRETPSKSISILTRAADGVNQLSGRLLVGARDRGISGCRRQRKDVFCLVGVLKVQ